MNFFTSILILFFLLSPFIFKNLNFPYFLDEKVFVGDAGIEVSPTAEDVAGFNTYIENYKAGLPIEEAAVKFK